MRKIFTLIVLISISSAVFSQTYLFNSSTTAVTTCSGTLYDDGGASSNYLGSQVNVLTLTPLTAGTSIQIMFNSWDVEAGTTLEFFDGPTTASPLLGFPFNNTVSPVGMNIMASISNPTGQLTMRWTTGSTVSSGFDASISCHTPCQSILVTIDSNSCTPNMVNDYIDVCYGDSVTFTAFGTYPQNGTAYTQSDATSLFIWDFGDGTADTGLVVTHLYPNASGYDFSVRIEDIQGCISNNYEAARVRHSSNPIEDIKPLPDICEGDTVDLLVGLNALSTVVINENQGGASGTLSIADTTYLPDGSGVSYTSTVVYTEFIPGATLTSASDFLGICASLFHSYSGDLTIELRCPNSTQITLTDQPGGSVQFGEPPVGPASGSSTPCYGSMGVAYDYCWDNSPTFGTMTAEASGAPSHTYTNVCGGSQTNSYYPAGSYTPDDPFTGLLGCPLNGAWSLIITDNIGLDEGYITAWSIQINPSLIPGSWTYDVPIDSISWVGPDITQTTDSTAYIATDSIGTIDYTLYIYDSFGCVYDTILSIAVLNNPIPDLGPDTALCEGNILHLDAGNIGTSYAWSTGPTTQNIDVDISGIYSVSVTNSNGNVSCYGYDTVQVDIVPWASVDLGPDLCIPSGPATLDAQNPGYNYTWSTGETTQTIDVNTTGTYNVSVSYGNYNMCGDDDEIYVSVIPTANVDLGPDFEMCRHEYAVLEASQTYPSLYTYLWSTGSTTTYIALDGMAIGNYTYSVQVIGCDTATDEISVTVIACDLTVPNIITPNGDGRNDEFKVTNLEYYPNSVLQIFNRWGKMIYENNNYMNDWNGEEFADGTYYFILKVNYGNEEYEDMHGTITIMRQ
ncbi:MAG: gliding motility-associated C-terminal domain-containing protein [Bacteroidales bacterium]|nr:gliding motility-associated C-terminal domain-containing protein [Bacteroidales bacterium]